MINKAEFKQLFDKYFDTIRSFIFYRCGDTDAASDMAQDVFMKIWEKYIMKKMILKRQNIIF